MESPAIHPESPLDQDEIPYPCMGCGEILEEGKAFELSGQRWHIDCFRCSTCGTLLDSDAHLLLLGDGSLICSNCTYSCNSCGNKIEDLAILTGDQAFCAQCFRCRNCKRKIENLRYARTSQGIFCMDCHESLMQRRRKKKAGATTKRPGAPGVKLDKSLPSLPPSMEETRSIDEAASDTNEVVETSHGHSEGRGDSSRADASSAGLQTATDNLLLPSSTYRSSRQIAQDRANDNDGGGEFLIPLAFDPSEAYRAPPQATSQPEIPRDYFGSMAAGDSSQNLNSHDHDQTLEPPSRTSSGHPSPHIAYQEKGREPREADFSRRDLDARNGWPEKPSTSHSDKPRFNRPSSARSSRSDLHLAYREANGSASASTSARPSAELRRPHEFSNGEANRPQRPTTMAYPPKRGDSLEGRHHQSSQKDVASSRVSSPHMGSPKPSDGTSDQSRKPSASGNVSLDSAASPSRLRSGDMDDDDQNSESLLRRISNGVRHGRSLSDRSIRLGKETKDLRSPAGSGSIGADFGSPTAGTTQAEEIAWLRSELRKERKRANDMEAVLNATADVKQVNTELSEKRSTMVVLDAQREIVLRELTVLTEHLEAEKRGAAGGPLDLGKFSNQVLRELAESIHKLKQSYSPQIEEMIQQRNDLTDELANLNRQKEKAFQEFEQLSLKNAQLAELNNTLVHQIQGLYKSTSDGQRGANGLGLISHGKDKSIGSLETLKPSIDGLTPSISTAHISDDIETQTATATIVPGPQVVNLRKGKFMNWKKGGQNVAKGVKGLKGAFMSSENVETGGGLPRSQTQDPSRQGFGFFGNQRSKQGGKMSQADSTPVLTEVAAGGLFGTELEARMEHEKSIIPAIITRCIQEVELRGMDMEGIYRKSGAASAIQGIREGFERSPFDYDISDPDLDIHAVTSALKQYFRKLPTPLITYEIYDKIIDSAEVTHAPTRIELLQKNLSELPRVHRDVLEFLVFHLKRVVERQEENLMTSQNIAVVFAPTIMRPESLAREMTDVQKKNDILKFLVDNCQDVFQGM
ncbi:hypothetical protein POX_d05559 [Penicillium oxalicum]|uniref:hypothetical protein n=1 Tax=Penicillium oxalicum TaxID=69781 RepID=UPI0020B6C87B|nr:hypothetical protein POX_d05559 [Penicillium oxalicum]KAI2790055.1 hypothetical protein POX_d05559 [Penicillium oxalicum]